MRTIAVMTFAAVITGLCSSTIAQEAVLERVNLEEGIRLALTSRPKPGDDLGAPWEQVRQTQEGLNASDKRVQSVLKKILKENMTKTHKQLKAKRLTEGALGTILREYPATDADELLTYIIEEQRGELRNLAIRTYLRVNDHRIEGPIKKVLINVLPIPADESAKTHEQKVQRSTYDERNRKVVYDELIKGFNKAVKNNNQEKKKRLLKLIHDDLIKKVYSRPDFVKLDKLLVKHKKGYKTSDLRYHQLYRIRPPQEPTPAEKYLNREYKELFQKKNSD